MFIETINIRIIFAIVLFIAGLICYLIAQRPALSKKEEKKLKELDDIIAALQPEKFHLSMSSNGHFLTKEKVYLWAIKWIKLQKTLEKI